MAMMKRGVWFLLVAGFLCAFPLARFAQADVQSEELVISTYYPSPSGSYEELKAERMAIGVNYYKNSVTGWDGLAPYSETAEVSLLVEGKVGIGTKDPQSMLDVVGNIQIESGGQNGRPVVWTAQQTLGYCVKFDGSGMCNESYAD